MKGRPSPSSDARRAPAAATAGWRDRLAWPPSAIFGLLFLSVLGAYLPALNGSLLWDDAGHVTRPDLQTLGGLWRIWFEFGATQQYYPVLHSAFWLEHQLWGDATLGYHLVNVILHATAAFLFGLVLRRLAVPGGWFAAFLFALHPICVESVAWISEQKNTLSAVFYLAAALAYLRFSASRRTGSYVVASLLFLVALLTKTVTATLPAALLVVSWWQHGRLEWRRDLRPLLPWLVLGLASGLVTARFERELIGAQGSDFDLNWVQRCLLAGRVVWFYLGKIVWPADLVFIYPRWRIDATDALLWLHLIAALVLVTTLAWWSRRQRGPLAALLLFGGTLFPVLGFLNVFPFVYSYVADHFQYLASLGIFALAAAGLASLVARLPPWGARGGGAVLLAILGGLSWRQSGLYRDVFTLYEATLAKNPACWMAHNNLAIALAGTGRVAEAIPHLEAALRLKPDYAPAENNLGDDLVQLGRASEAIPHLERALRLHPNYPFAHRNLGLALATLGRTEEAISHFQEAVRLDPTYADAELNWAIGLMLTKRFGEAVPHFERALKLNPNSAYLHDTYGRALADASRLEEAIAHFQRALELAPDSAETHLNLAQVLRRAGRLEEAESHALTAQRLQR